MVVTTNCRASHARLSNIAKHRVRYICYDQYTTPAKQMCPFQLTQYGVSDCASLETGIYLYPTRANAANAQKCTVLHARSHTESEANRASKQTTWNQEVQRIMKKATYDQKL
jgi:hypothetical protein